VQADAALATATPANIEQDPAVPPAVSPDEDRPARLN